MNITFIASYVPRKCGIATYTRDLAEELIKQGNMVKIFALENEGFHAEYAPDVSGTLNQNNFEDYKKAAMIINDSNTEIVHVQHEFGLYGGEDGDFILRFLELLRKPIVVTYHTVLITPTQHQLFIMQELARLSRAVIVMEPIAKDRLLNTYNISPQLIHIIYHGVPNIEGIMKTAAKKQLGLTNRFVILANNLIAPNKGYEYVLEALPMIREKIPQCLFIVVGETHPVVKMHEGESYREKLHSLVKTFQVEKQVEFINEYISLDNLRMYLSAADIYVTPYLDPQQITSGTLSYAIGVGKACISTPYIYAKNILQHGRGILVPFHDSNAIARSVIELYENTEKRKHIEQKARKFGKKMRWNKVAHNHSTLYKRIIQDPQQITKLALQLIRKKPDLSHLEFLTDDLGILQHTHYLIPERRFGYSTDDNARALIVASSWYAKRKSMKLFSLIKKYVSFLHLAQESNGRFHTFLNFQHLWIDADDVADPYGKAIWALGYHLYSCPETIFSNSVDLMFKLAMRQIETIRDIRCAAYTILGLYYYYLAFEGEKETADMALEKIIFLANFLQLRYKDNHEETWEWFEKHLTYDNFRIPQSLFAAYVITKNSEYKDLAEKTLAFLKENNFSGEYGFFDFIGQNGWYINSKTKAVYDQQPLEASAASDSYIFAHKATGEKKYKDFALCAFEWFLGRNRNKISLLDERTGGIYDGLTPTGVNQNEGAESLVCFLITRYFLREALKKV